MRWASVIPRQVRILTMETTFRNGSDEKFLELAQEIAEGEVSAVLLSGGGLDCSRYSIACGDPFLILRAKGRNYEVITPKGCWRGEGDPISLVDDLLTHLEPDFPLATPPFMGGAVGYFAYELKNTIEKLPQSASDDLLLPDLFLFFPRDILIYDRAKGTINRILLAYGEEENAFDIPLSEQGDSKPDTPLEAGELRSNFTHQEYLEAVRHIRRYIREGDVYQVNLSQRFSFPFRGDPWRLWIELFRRNPAPFYAFVNGGDHQILSTSMERFLFRQDDYIETRPIKGTRRRGRTKEEDKRLKKELLKDPKEDAELSMIVDLLRNDLGRVCAPKTIRVAEHKRVEEYQNVFHLISIITGKLRPGITYGDILRATFPGGSITGCPKIRAMEIIDELEPNVRHVYTGCIGYLGWHKNMDLNIGIRTGILHKGLFHFAVGGGVVYDSDEEAEYQETLHKGQTLFDLIRSLKKTFRR